MCDKPRTHYVKLAEKTPPFLRVMFWREYPTKGFCEDHGYSLRARLRLIDGLESEVLPISLHRLGIWQKGILECLRSEAILPDPTAKFSGKADKYKTHYIRSFVKAIRQLQAEGYYVFECQPRYDYNGKSPYHGQNITMYRAYKVTDTCDHGRG